MVKVYFWEDEVLLCSFRICRSGEDQKITGANRWRRVEQVKRDWQDGLKGCVFFLGLEITGGTSRRQREVITSWTLGEVSRHHLKQG